MPGDEKLKMRAWTSGDQLSVCCNNPAADAVSENSRSGLFRAWSMHIQRRQLSLWCEFSGTV